MHDSQIDAAVMWGDDCIRDDRLAIAIALLIPVQDELQDAETERLDPVKAPPK